MTDKELNDYILNSFIMSFDRGLSQTFEKLTLKTIASYGTSDSELSKGLKSKLKTKGIEEIYKIQLLKSGFIKVTNDKIPLEYGLTKRGKKVQELGGLLEFLKYERHKRISKYLKSIALYILPTLTAIISTGGLIFTIIKNNPPIEIKQPIKIHIDSLPQTINYHSSTPSKLKNYDRNIESHDTNKENNKPQ